MYFRPWSDCSRDFLFGIIAVLKLHFVGGDAHIAPRAYDEERTYRANVGIGPYKDTITFSKSLQGVGNYEHNQDQ